VLTSRDTLPCTSFVIDKGEELVFATNLDFMFGEGYLFVNNRGVVKQGYMAGTTGETAKWTSKYGSVTFNLAGREFAWGGMNEAGLVVSTMWLDVSVLPAPDQRPPMNSGFWVQYQLDNFSTVEEVIQSDSLIRLVQDRCHFLVCDASGACAAIEFLDGKRVYHTGETMPIKALTNIPYEEALFHAMSNTLPEEDPEDQSSHRFIQAKEKIDRFDPGAGVTPTRYAMDILTETVFRPHTRWNIVFDIKKKKINFRTRENAKERSIRFGGLDFACGSSVKMLEVNKDLSGDITGRLPDYSQKLNVEHFEGFCKKYGIAVTHEDALWLTTFIENFPCAE
jgi:choloylglycine hydrolase